MLFAHAFEDYDLVTDYVSVSPCFVRVNTLSFSLIERYIPRRQCRRLRVIGSVGDGTECQDKQRVLKDT